MAHDRIPEPVRFHFHDLRIDSKPVHDERSAGMHDGSWLVLGEFRIPDSQIVGFGTNESVIVLGFHDTSGQHKLVQFVVYGRTEPVRDALNFGISRRDFATRLAQAAHEGRGRDVRETVCPYCHAKTLTMDRSQSPQVWCSYCDSLITTIPVDGLGNIEKDYRICPECKMYSRPRKFSEGYFYFLVVHAGVHHKEHFCCSGCMRPRVWKMLFGNLFGLLGMPLAITQWFRVYMDSARGMLRGLDSANRSLRRRRIDRAIARYSRIVEKHPFSAGVLYNLARGLLARNDLEHGRQTLELAVSNCANYAPAIALLAELNAKSRAAARPNGL
jgi:hypothetical protein